MYLKRKTVKGVTNSLLRVLPTSYYDDYIFVCIGTDRSTGDALGPIVGSKLKELGYSVLGTIHDPVHAKNLNEIIEKLPTNKTIIAIDAALGKFESIGKIIISNKPLKPGAGVNKELSPVGDISISGIVNIGGFMEYYVLQNTRLSLVIKLANLIITSISEALPVISEEVAVTKA